MLFLRSEFQMIQVSGINVFPIKSCQAMAKKTATMTLSGFFDDRMWAIIDSDTNKILSQKFYPPLARISIHPVQNHLQLRFDGKQPLNLPLKGIDGKEVEASYKEEVFIGIDQGDQAALWLEMSLNRSTALIKLKTGERRLVPDQHIALPEDITTFTEGYPAILINEASV